MVALCRINNNYRGEQGSHYSGQHMAPQLRPARTTVGHSVRPAASPVSFSKDPMINNSVYRLGIIFWEICHLCVFSEILSWWWQPPKWLVSWYIRWFVIFHPGRVTLYWSCQSWVTVSSPVTRDKHSENINNNQTCHMPEMLEMPDILRRKWQ